MPSGAVTGTIDVDGLVVDDVDVDASCGGAMGAIGLAGFSFRSSGDAVYSGSTGTPASAPCMVAAKIDAGYEPPVTTRPCTLFIGTRPSVWPTHTAVDSCGTKPTNQASL